MAHVTSQWANQYGLPDPAASADDLRRADVAALRAAVVRWEAVNLSVGQGGDRARNALAMLQQGWSTPQATRAVATLAQAGDRLADSARAAARAVVSLAEALERAHRDVERTYAHADATITARQLRREPLATNAAEIAAIAAERQALVCSMHAEMRSAEARLEAAALGATHALAVDPRDLLPHGVAAPSTNPGARDLDARNRAALAADRASPDGRHALFARAVQRALDEAAAHGQAVQLLTYDADSLAGHGAAAIAVGDIAYADTVSVLVPGVANSPTDMSGAVRLSADLAAATARSGPAGATSAAIAWFGYDIPLSWAADQRPIGGRNPVASIVTNSVLAIDASAAVSGAVRLAAFTREMRTMIAPSAAVTLIGHSYGSTVVSQAARIMPPEADIDDIVLLGSPGAGYRVATAHDYTAVPADHVYTVAFPGDPIPNDITDLIAELANPAGIIARALAMGDRTGPFGADPNAPAFDAQAIMVPSGISWNGGVDLGQHALDNYLSGPALQAVAAVAAGRYSVVPVRRDR